MPDSQADTRTGRSGGDRGKDQRLTLGGLFAFPGDPEHGAGDGFRRAERSQHGERQATLFAGPPAMLTIAHSIGTIGGRGLAIKPRQIL